MDQYKLEKANGDSRLKVPKRGTSLLRYPLYNKGSGFTQAERKRFGLEGLLPAQINTIETQAERVFKSIMFNPDPVGRHIDLAALQDHNEHLFYKVLSDNLEALMPIVYTPTVGKASQYFSRVFRRTRGIWITPEHKGRIEQILRTAAPFSDVRLIVVTDNEAILGIGDQGAGGMAISVGKLSLYCAGAGIHPAQTLPISLDVGTNNQSLLEDPLYLGWREPRLRGDAYLELLDEFVAAIRNVFPKVVVQWEDFRKDNALAILNRFRDRIPSFNDDIQGTGAVAYACVLGANRITGTDLKDNRVLIFGAGAAGYGIAREIRSGIAQSGLSGDALARSVLAMDSRGILADDRDLEGYKAEIAWPAALAHDLNLAEGDRCNLKRVVEAYKPNVLIGTSGQPGSFDEGVIQAMDAAVDTPVILPMSNPDSISEAKPEAVLRLTEGRALVATGSPFDDVQMRGGPRRISQANNVFVFPGLGLGTIISGATRVTDGMIGASARALAESLNAEEIEAKCLMPDVSRLWEVCGYVATAVAKQAVEDGVTTNTDMESIGEAVNAFRWTPVYPEMVES